MKKMNWLKIQNQLAHKVNCLSLASFRLGGVIGRNFQRKLVSGALSSLMTITALSVPGQLVSLSSSAQTNSNAGGNKASGQNSQSDIDFKKIPQFVLLAFDGSYENSFWEESRQFAREMTAQDKPVKFTYFISGVYWTDPNQFLDVYHAPHISEETADSLRQKYMQSSDDKRKSMRSAYYSNIGFGDAAEDIEERSRQLNLAFLEGHEVASHANSHKAGGIAAGYKGKANAMPADQRRAFQEQAGFDWNLSQWDYEFSKFTELIFDVFKRYSFKAFKRFNFTQDDVVGFRAPLLSYNPEMYQVMKEHNFKYDTSGTALLGYWPKKGLSRHNLPNSALSELSSEQRRIYSQNAIWDFPLTYLPLNKNETGSKIYTSGVPSMDFNFCNNYLIWTRPDPKNPNRTLSTACPTPGAVKAIKAANGDPNGPAFDRSVYEKNYFLMLTKYMAYFKTHYNGNRAPVHIGHHFSKWADGAYWDAMKQFARNVCGLPDVRCVTYTELMNYMDKLNNENPALLAKLQASQKPLDRWTQYFNYLDDIEGRFQGGQQLISARAKVYVEPKIAFNGHEFKDMTQLSAKAKVLGYRSQLMIDGVPFNSNSISLNDLRKEFAGSSDMTEVSAVVTSKSGEVLERSIRRIRSLGSQDERIDLMNLEDKNKLGDQTEAHEGEH